MGHVYRYPNVNSILMVAVITAVGCFSRTKGKTEVGDWRTQDDLVFKTIDGSDISLDVIIVYRIDANK